MFKKRITTSLLAVSLLSVGGEAAFASTVQNQANSAFAGQSQNVTGSKLNNLSQFQNVNKNVQAAQIGTNSGAGQGQAGSVTSSQVQAGTTHGPAVFTQNDSTSLTLADQQKVKGSTQNQTTNAGNSQGQTTIVDQPSHVLQGDINHTAAIQFQVDIAGGPKIQHQQAQQNSAQQNIALPN